MKTPIALSCLLTLALSISSPSYGQSFNEWNGYLEAKTFYKKGEIDSAAKRLILIAEHHSFLTIDSLKSNFPDSIDLFRFAIERFRKRDQAMQRPFRPRLAALMDSIYKEDQKGRTIFDGLHNADDASNYRFVDSILSIHGFMSESELGFYGSQTQFLVIQHSTLEEMEKWFPVLTKAVDEGVMPMWCYAWMYDRMQVYKGKKQLYGSQEGIPIEDEAGLLKRKIRFGIL
ncbi:MAG: hypothetical protein ACK57D_05190 [Sphingobacteriales bacterium]